jgi:hypothetical protein
MDMRNLLTLLVACIALQPVMATDSTALGLDVSIKESITGHVAWFSLSNGPAQRFSVRWENIGSVNCLARPRIDFYESVGNASAENPVYTAWGSEDAVLSGGSSEWELYSSLPEGDYGAVLRMYHCNEIFEEEPYGFTAPGSTPGESLVIESVDVHRDYIDVIVSGDSDGAVVIPEDYPRGWIFQSGVVEENTARLMFVPVSHVETAVSVRAVSPEGDYAERRFSITVPEEENATPWWALVAVAAALIFLLYVSRNIINTWRR